MDARVLGSLGGGRREARAVRTVRGGIGRGGWTTTRRQEGRAAWEVAKERAAKRKETWDRWDEEQRIRERQCKREGAKDAWKQEEQALDRRRRNLERFRYHSERVERAKDAKDVDEGRQLAGLRRDRSPSRRQERPPELERVRDLKDNARIRQAARKAQGSLESYSIQELRARVADFERVASTSPPPSTDKQRPYTEEKTRSSRTVMPGQANRRNLKSKRRSLRNEEGNGSFRSASRKEARNKSGRMSRWIDGSGDSRRGWESMDFKVDVQGLLLSFQRLFREDEGLASMPYRESAFPGEEEMPYNSPRKSAEQSVRRGRAGKKPTKRKRTRVPPRVQAERQARAREAAWAAFRGEAPPVAAGAVLGGKRIDW